MIFPREQIYSALFSVLQGALLTPAGPFKMVSRRWQDPSQLSPADRPSLYQVQKDELTGTSVNGLPILARLTVDLVIYTAGDSDSQRDAGDCAIAGRQGIALPYSGKDRDR